MIATSFVKTRIFLSWSYWTDSLVLSIGSKLLVLGRYFWIWSVYVTVSTRPVLSLASLFELFCVKCLTGFIRKTQIWHLKCQSVAKWYDGLNIRCLRPTLSICTEIRSADGTRKWFIQKNVFDHLKRNRSQITYSTVSYENSVIRLAWDRQCLFVQTLV